VHDVSRDRGAGGGGRGAARAGTSGLTCQRSARCARGRDLLESIVYPSSSIARGFEPFVLETRDGKAYAGTLAGESADAIRLKTPAEIVIPRSQIKVFRPDRVSIMPQGLDAQLSRQELSDLLAFLQACK
jgi:putative heme-binding domain-containing protein